MDICVCSCPTAAPTATDQQSIGFAPTEHMFEETKDEGSAKASSPPTVARRSSLTADDQTELMKMWVQLHELANTALDNIMDFRGAFRPILNYRSTEMLLPSKNWWLIDALTFNNCKPYASCFEDLGPSKEAEDIWCEQRWAVCEAKKEERGKRRAAKSWNLSIAEELDYVVNSIQTAAAYAKSTLTYSHMTTLHLTHQNLVRQLKEETFDHIEGKLQLIDQWLQMSLPATLSTFHLDLRQLTAPQSEEERSVWTAEYDEAAEYEDPPPPVSGIKTDDGKLQWEAEWQLVLPCGKPTCPAASPENTTVARMVDDGDDDDDDDGKIPADDDGFCDCAEKEGDFRWKHEQRLVSPVVLQSLRPHPTDAFISKEYGWWVMHQVLLRRGLISPNHNKQQDMPEWAEEPMSHSHRNIVYVQDLLEALPLKMRTGGVQEDSRWFRDVDNNIVLLLPFKEAINKTQQGVFKALNEWLACDENSITSTVGFATPVEWLQICPNTIRDNDQRLRLPLAANAQTNTVTGFSLFRPYLSVMRFSLPELKSRFSDTSQETMFLKRRSPLPTERTQQPLFAKLAYVLQTKSLPIDVIGIVRECIGDSISASEAIVRLTEQEIALRSFLQHGFYDSSVSQLLPNCLWHITIGDYLDVKPTASSTVQCPHHLNELKDQKVYYCHNTYCAEGGYIPAQIAMQCNIDPRCCCYMESRWNAFVKAAVNTTGYHRVPLYDESTQKKCGVCCDKYSALRRRKADYVKQQQARLAKKRKQNASQTKTKSAKVGRIL